MYQVFFLNCYFNKVYFFLIQKKLMSNSKNVFNLIVFVFKAINTFEYQSNKMKLSFIYFTPKKKVFVTDGKKNLIFSV